MKLRPIIVGPGGYYELQAGTILGYEWKCPACDEHFHWFKTAGTGTIWTFDGNLDSPTFNPSLLMKAPDGSVRCHSFVKAGQIQYCPDCPHAFAGKTIPLPDILDA